MIFLIYLFQGFKFEFEQDYIIIYDYYYRRKYKLRFSREETIPFIIELLEKDIKI